MPKEVIVISDSDDTTDSATTKDSKGATDPIDIDDSDDGVAAAGMKRGNTDKEGAGASKQLKGKQVAKPEFHPRKPRPKPTKKNAKVSKIWSLAVTHRLTRNLG